MPRCGVVPKFSDLEVIALSLPQETMGYSYDMTKASVHDIKYLNDVGQD